MTTSLRRRRGMSLGSTETLSKTRETTSRGLQRAESVRMSSVNSSWANPSGSGFQVIRCNC